MQQGDFILVKTETRGKLIKILLSEIIFIEGLGNYVAINTAKDKILCLITFKELEIKLSLSHFIRVHKSFIISIANITMIEGNQIRLGTYAVPIGENYKSKLLEALGDKIINKK
jgi:two-component system, LytTR family, response regulator